MRPRVLTLCIALLFTCAGVALAQETIRCESNDGRRHYCDVGPNREVRFARQASESPCERGRTYGIEGNRIWVDRGCRADFQVFRGGPGGPGPGPDARDRGWDRGGPGGQTTVIRCDSSEGGRQTCSAPGAIRRARVSRQISQSECRQGYSWGYTRDGLWVDHGCRAEFEVQTR
jgi:hypothetical protein